MNNNALNMNKVSFIHPASQGKKVLAITNVNFLLKGELSKNINVSPENLIVFKSFGTVISQPYGCLLRNIIIAVYKNNVDKIYIIGDKDCTENVMDYHLFLESVKKEGISDDIIRTIDYLIENTLIAGKNYGLINWLEGSKTVEENIAIGVKMLKEHPLIPKRISVYGLIYNRQTNDFASITE